MDIRRHLEHLSRAVRRRELFLESLSSLYLYTAITVIPVIGMVHVSLATGLFWAALVELLRVCSQEGKKRHVFLVV